MAPAELRLPYEGPFDWELLVGFLSPRAVPGVEIVAAGAYLRTARSAGGAGVLEVRDDPDRGELLVTASRPALLGDAAQRVRALFDLEAPGKAIVDEFSGDPLLGPLIAQSPGVRVPGSWDPFETAVRAVIGQVVSVRVATTLSGRLATLLGNRLPREERGLTHLYPAPERLAEADLSGVGLSRQKIASIRALARGVAAGELRFAGLTDLEGALERLQELPGIGSWTAHYIAMRALGQRDAFPAGDLILRRAAAPEGAPLGQRELESLSQRWRPYRAYAAMLLWASYARRMERRKQGGTA